MLSKTNLVGVIKHVNKLLQNYLSEQPSDHDQYQLPLSVLE